MSRNTVIAGPKVYVEGDDADTWYPAKEWQKNAYLEGLRLRNSKSELGRFAYVTEPFKTRNRPESYQMVYQAYSPHGGDEHFIYNVDTKTARRIFMVDFPKHKRVAPGKGNSIFNRNKLGNKYSY